MRLGLACCAELPRLRAGVLQDNPSQAALLPGQQPDSSASATPAVHPAALHPQDLLDSHDPDSASQAKDLPGSDFRIGRAPHAWSPEPHRASSPPTAAQAGPGRQQAAAVTQQREPGLLKTASLCQVAEPRACAGSSPDTPAAAMASLPSNPSTAQLTRGEGTAGTEAAASAEGSPRILAAAQLHGCILAHTAMVSLLSELEVLVSLLVLPARSTQLPAAEQHASGAGLQLLHSPRLAHAYACCALQHSGEGLVRCAILLGIAGMPGRLCNALSPAWVAERWLSCQLNAFIHCGTTASSHAGSVPSISGCRRPAARPQRRPAPGAARPAPAAGGCPTAGEPH